MGKIEKIKKYVGVSERPSENERDLMREITVNRNKIDEIIDYINKEPKG